MDVQRKKGLLDVCVLAVLQRGPSYGYRIVRDVSACIAVSESTLYPILRRLEANGLVITNTQEHNGRTRKYYEITQPGRARIETFLDEWEEVKHIYAFIKGTSEANKNKAAEAQPEENAVLSDAERTAATGNETAEAYAAGRGLSETEQTEANGIETIESRPEDGAGVSEAEATEANGNESAETPGGWGWAFRCRKNGGSI